jgi:hypothetical protein
LVDFYDSVDGLRHTDQLLVRDTLEVFATSKTASQNRGLGQQHDGRVQQRKGQELQQL